LKFNLSEFDPHYFHASAWFLLIIFCLILFANPREQLGDVNNDGDINVLDIVRVVNIILENDPLPTDYELWAGDVNVDESVNVQDVVIIVTIILQTFDCPTLYSPCSDNLSECCLDPTSHEFEYELDTFGNYGSWINDVQIVSEDNIWIVGSIETDSIEYNAAHWDGNAWDFMEIINTSDLNSIRFFSENNIWALGSYPIHWDGENWTLYHLTQMGIIPGGLGGKIWAKSENDIYFIGRLGRIIHYNGDTFEQMESGTEVDLHDISGSEDGEHLFAVGLTNSDWWGNLILEFSDGSWSTLYESDHYLPDNGDFGAVLNVSVHADTAYIMTMGGLWKYNYLDQGSDFVSENNYNEGNYYHSKHITVLGFNDIFTVSSRWNTAHYNGETWYYDNDVNHNFGNGNVWVKSADYNDSMFVIVGYISNPQTGLVMRCLRE